VSEHPHWGFTKHGLAVHLRTADHHKGGRFNRALAVLITSAVGSMWCAYAFTLLALASLPAVLAQAFHLRFFPSWLVSAGLIALVAWIAQTFLQLVLLSVIMVGQNVQTAASDARAEKQFGDVETILGLLDLETAGGLAVVLAEARRAVTAAEASQEAVKALVKIVAPTPMKRTASGRFAPRGGSEGKGGAS
jgi:hypothetical protein